jgi:hypothetical protein
MSEARSSCIRSAYLIVLMLRPPRPHSNRVRRSNESPDKMTSNHIDAKLQSANFAAVQLPSPLTVVEVVAGVPVVGALHDGSFSLERRPVARARFGEKEGSQPSDAPWSLVDARVGTSQGLRALPSKAVQVMTGWRNRPWRSHRPWSPRVSPQAELRIVIPVSVASRTRGSSMKCAHRAQQPGRAALTATPARTSRRPGSTGTSRAGR